MSEQPTINECLLCKKPDHLKQICPYRDYPFNEAKLIYKDKDCRCSKIKRQRND